MAGGSYVILLLDPRASGHPGSRMRRLASALRRTLLPSLLLLGAWLGLPATASAANILVVSDAFTDTNIAMVLQGDGHTVTLVTGDYMGGTNPTLAGDLSAYDAVFWSATVNGFGGTHASGAVFT